MSATGVARSQPEHARCIYHGAGRNIGAPACSAWPRTASDVVLNGSSDRAACDKVAKEAETLGAKTLVVMGRRRQAEDCKKIADTAIKQFGAATLLVNNAALRPTSRFSR